MNRLIYEATPNLEWFHAWEPYDTMVSATAYYNSVSFSQGQSLVTLAEPWLALEGSEPLGRTLLAFVGDARFRWRAAARGGEHFNTRVSFLESAKAPTVQLMDASWNSHMLTFAASASEAEAAFPTSARQALASLGFSGHIEVRPSGMILHFAGTQPTPEHYNNLAAIIPQVIRGFFPG